jgi:AcrR family transcriptional regulator
VSPARTYLDRDTVVRAAADLADRDGWHAVTLSAVAKEVDRHVSSLYAHVDGLAGLHRAVALLAFDELSEEVWRAALGRTKGDALEAIAQVYRDYARRHPGRTAALQSARHTDDADLGAAGLRLAEPVRAVLASFGLDDARVQVAHRIFSGMVFGLLRTEEGPEDLHQAIALLTAGLASGDWPG